MAKILGPKEVRMGSGKGAL
jgi:hypothetical protein